MAKRTTDGKFKKQLKVWDGSNWNDGWHDNRGRFRVYRPDYPRAYSGGYALRPHVVWWLANGKPHSKGTVLHHKNGIKDDDRLDNLEVIEVGEHTRLHCSQEGIELICKNCGISFSIPVWRQRQRRKEGYKPKFCSQECYHAFKRSDGHKHNISNGLKRAYKDGRGPMHQFLAKQKSRLHGG